jgi:hypothetical protein
VTQRRQHPAGPAPSRGPCRVPRGTRPAGDAGVVAAGTPPPTSRCERAPGAISAHTPRWSSETDLSPDGSGYMERYGASTAGSQTERNAGTACTGSARCPSDAPTRGGGRDAELGRPLASGAPTTGAPARAWRWRRGVRAPRHLTAVAFHVERWHIPGGWRCVPRGTATVPVGDGPGWALGCARCP